MFEKKKLLIIGPPGVGKSTIKNVFFDMVNPINFISTSIEPTRGIDSKVYKLWEYELGVFDLAGQENDSWFTNERDVFLDSDVILCIFDCNMYIKEIQDFFMKFIVIYNEMNLKYTSIVVFFHKIDLIQQIMLHHKIKAFKEFIKNNINIEKVIIVYPTSIASDFFMDTFNYIAKILEITFSKNILNNEGLKISEIRRDLEILITYDVNKPIHFDNLFYDYNLHYNDALIHLKRLEKLGLLDISIDTRRFVLTDKAKIFKSIALKNEINTYKINRILDAMYLFSNLKEKLDLN